MAQVFRIQNAEGLFSTGGTYPMWTKKGKLWTSKGALSNHLGLVKPSVYKDAKLITYELTEQEIGSQSLQEFLAEKALRKAVREQAEQARIEAWRREQRHREYLKLQAEFGDV